MSQSFDLTGPSVTTHVQFNGADCEKMMLNGTRIWERYITQQQVWVTSGYNQSGWVLERSYVGPSSGWWFPRVINYAGQWYFQLSGWYNAINTMTNSSALYQYGKKFTAGASAGVMWGFPLYGAHQYQQGTTWIDTSGYETQNVTAYYY